MVAVRVADEDIPHLTVVEFVLAELPLRTFAAVDHVELPQTADNLRGSVVTERRLGTAATEDGDFEWSHISLRFVPHTALFRRLCGVIELCRALVPSGLLKE